MTDDKEMLLSNQQRLSTVNQNLEVEKRELHSRLNKLITENDRLNGLSFEICFQLDKKLLFYWFVLEDWKVMNSKLTECESKILESTARLEEAQSRESTITVKYVLFA